MKVYLAGGINNLPDAECKDWRERAKALLLFETLDPMRRDYRGAEDANYEAIVANDLADIAECSALLVRAYRASWGTAMEMVYAQQQGKFIVAFMDNAPTVSPWLRKHCDGIYDTLGKAVDAIHARFGLRFE